MNKIVSGIEKILNREFHASGHDEFMDSGYLKAIAERISNSLEIDEEKIMHILLDALAKLQNEHFTQQILARSSSRMCGKNYQVVDFLAKAIADKKPIKIKDK